MAKLASDELNLFQYKAVVVLCNVMKRLGVKKEDAKQERKRGEQYLVLKESIYPHAWGYFH